MQARRLAYVAMADVPDLVDGVEDRIEQLLLGALHLLDDNDSEEA